MLEGRSEDSLRVGDNPFATSFSLLVTSLVFNGALKSQSLSLSEVEEAAGGIGKLESSLSFRRNASSTKSLASGARLTNVCDSMREYCFTVECDQRTFTVRYNSRELTFIVLGKPLIPAADEFKKAVGLWDNFSVAHGMDTKAWTVRSRSELVRAVEHFEQAIEADRELLKYDYQYGFSSIPNQKNSAARGAGSVGGKIASISAKHPGQLYLELREKGEDGKWRVVETRDLRKGPPLVTDELGTIKVYRRKNKIDWKPKLSQLLEFLRSSNAESVRIRHHYPE